MNTPEFILSILGSNILTSVITTLLNRKSEKIKNRTDEIVGLQNHIDFLNKQIDNLENRIAKLDKLCCYVENCKIRTRM